MVHGGSLPPHPYIRSPDGFFWELFNDTWGMYWGEFNDEYIFLNVIIIAVGGELCRGGGERGRERAYEGAEQPAKD